MRLLLALVAAVAVFVVVGMLVAPHQPEMRAWYLNNACPLLDRLSSDICAAVRREAGGEKQVWAPMPDAVAARQGAARGAFPWARVPPFTPC
jgi:hypothetical protein